MSQQVWSMGGDEKLIIKESAELPEEVVHREILPRLPLKSVARSKCVSKSWLSLFSNPQFVKQHLTFNTTQTPDDHDCLVAKKSNVAKKANQIVILTRDKETFQLPLCRFELVGSVRGLVCLEAAGLKFSLWNPAIHQFKEFSIPQRRCRDRYDDIGFGFDALTDCYKVVVLSMDLTFASVYCSDFDNWIDVSVPDAVFPENRGMSMKNPVTIAKDCPYWTFVRYTDEMHPYRPYYVTTAAHLTAVKFDAGSNKFKKLPELYFDFKVDGNLDRNHAFRFECVDIKDCLSLIQYYRESCQCMLDIYGLDEEEPEGCSVWSKMYSIGPLDYPERHFIMLQGFYGGEIVFHDQEILSRYDQKTDTIECLGTSDHWLHCFRYTPSLVFLEGMKSIYAAGLDSTIPWRLIHSFYRTAL